MSVKVKQALSRALNDPGIIEWRASGNTLQIDVYKADGRVELFDLLESPDTPAQAISIEELEAALEEGPHPPRPELDDVR